MTDDDEATKELEDELTCAVCLQLFQKPKVLTCHHVFCTACLVKCVIRNDQSQSVVVCPTCRKHTPVTGGGVADLPVSFQTNKLFDVRDRLLSRTAPKETAPAKNVCSLHEGKLLELWCEGCQELICFHCSLEGEKHHNHNYGLLAKTHLQAKEDIKAAIAPLQEHRSKVEEALKSTMEYLGKLHREEDVAKEAICDTANKLQEMISKAKIDMLKDLDAMVDSKMKQVTPHKDQLETSLTQLDNCIKSVERKLDENNPEGLVSAKRSLCLKTAQLVQEFKPGALARSYEGSIKFKYGEETLRDALRDSFLLFFSDVCPSKCKASGVGLAKAIVGKESSFSLDLLTADGQPTKVPVKDIRCELVSDITTKGVDVSMPQLDSSAKVAFSYIPTTKGRHILSVKVEAEHVQGSPFGVAIQSTTSDYGSPMNIIDTSPNPLGVMVLQDGRIVVTSFASKSIDLYDQRGNLLCKHVENFYTSFTFKRGTSIFAVDRDRAVFEVDVDDPSSSSLQLSAPQFAYIGDVAFDSANNTVFLLYYDLIGSNKPQYVEAVNLRNKDKFNFGEQGNRNGQLNSPRGLTLEAKSSRLFVADTNNHRVQVFTAKGKFVLKFGKEGTSSGCLTHPTSLVVHLEQVFVGDAANCVSVFSVKGQYLFNIGISCGVEKIESLSVDRSGVLYVCDTNKSRLLLF